MTGSGGFSTRAVHAGSEPDDATGAVGVPVYQSSTFQHPRRRLSDGSWTDNPDWIYTRYSNPTTRAVERKVAALEGTEDALVFTSGMGAISACILGNVEAGDHVVAMSDIYGGSVQLLQNQVPSLGVRVSMVPGADWRAVVDACEEGTRVVYLEIPTNPFNRVLDLPALVEALDSRFGASGRPLVVVDSTLGSPANFRPVEHGADLAVHSATKYLNGHSDVIAGAVAGSRERIAALRPWLKSIGASMDPHQAFLLGRGMRTLALRMQTHNAAGARIASFLAGHEKVERVWYVGVDDHPDTDVASRLLEGFGSIVSFQLVSRDAKAAERLVESLRYFQYAPSLGGVESLVTLPCHTSHKFLDDEGLAAAGLSRTFVRLAVGIEDVADLERDLATGLDAV